MTLAQVQRIRAGHQAQLAARDATITALTARVAELKGANDPAIQAELDAFEAEVNPNPPTIAELAAHDPAN